MSTTTQKKTDAAKQRPLLPPPEAFWKKYSSRHEFPFSTAASIFLHVFVVGLILLIGFLAQLRWYSPENKPVESDVVTLEGEPGLEGGSGPAGAPGEGDRPTEFSLPGTADPYAGLISKEPMDVDDSPVEIDPNAVRPDAKDDASSTDIIQKLLDAGKEPEDKKTPPAKATDKKPKATPKKSNGGGVKGGTFGSGGTGFGTGTGSGTGPGTGGGGFGRPLTRQEFLARRWKFDLAGSPKVHMDKLTKVGFVVGIEGVDGRFYTITDLKSVPVEVRLDNYAKYKDAVQWENRVPESVMSVAKEMGLTMPVKGILLFLPKDREEKIAREEQRFAKQIRRTLKSFQHIWFDFEFRDGAYEPKAKAVEPAHARQGR